MHISLHYHLCHTRNFGCVTLQTHPHTYTYMYTCKNTHKYIKSTFPTNKFASTTLETIRKKPTMLMQVCDFWKASWYAINVGIYTNWKKVMCVCVCIYIYINTSGKKLFFISHYYFHFSLSFGNKVVLLDTELWKRPSQFTEKSLVFDHYELENFENQCYKVFELGCGQQVPAHI